MTRTNFIQDDDATLDYVFDWRAETHGRSDAEGDWLAEGEEIDTYEITVETGLTLGTGIYAPTVSDGAVKVWLIGGVAGEVYKVACKIVTTNLPPRIDERTAYIIVEKR